ncbi:unnamed protein product [Rotaria sp. Silwood2]|nr:unnamed protein product [Rotaria sp. Silwood2]
MYDQRSPRKVKVLLDTTPQAAVFIAQFSAVRTLRRIFTMEMKNNSDSFDFLNGVRVLSLFWVIFGHTFVFNSNYASNSVDALAWSQNIAFQLIVSGLFSVDTFFVLSGFLTAVLFVRQITKEKLTFRLFILYYIHRYIRLTPTFVLVILVSINLTPYFGRGPLYPSKQGFEPDGCSHRVCLIFHLYVGVTYFTEIYIKPWGRISAYAIGLLTGFIVISTGPYVKAKYDLIELKQRILYNKPSKIIYEKASSTLKTLVFEETTDVRIHQRQIDQEEKQLQIKMTDLMVEAILEAEKKVIQCHQILNHKIKNVSENNDDTMGRLTTPMMDLIYRRFTIIDKKYECNSNFQTNYYFRNHFDDSPNTVTLKKYRFSPTMSMATQLHLFSNEQLTLLNRGPTYVPLYQNYISAISNGSTIDDFINEQFKVLKHDLSIFYAKQNINMAQSMFISKEIKEAYSNAFTLSLPDSLFQRGFYEQKLVESIQNHLKQYDLILRRTANKKNVFYLDTRLDFEEKINTYMATTEMFELCEVIDQSTNLNDYLERMINNFNENIELYLDDRKKYKHILDKIMVHIGQVEMPYLYFLPDISQVSSFHLTINHFLVYVFIFLFKKQKISAVPIVTSTRAITSRYWHHT